MTAAIEQSLPASGGTLEVDVEQVPSTKNWPSYLYLGLFLVNSVVLAGGSAMLEWSSLWVLLPFMVIQGLFFMGMLELLHQAVHYNFVTNRRANDIIGSMCAALVGINLVAYRYFHLTHHRHTCDEEDPEGILYAQSPATRLMVLACPVEHAFVALQINRLASRYVPERKRAQWFRSRCVLALVLALIVGLAFWAPMTFVAAYFLPLCVFSWVDFFFSQAEHYDAKVRPVSESADVGKVSYDIVIPTLLSHLMLNRNLHAVHHVWPRTRWFEAPQRAAELKELQGDRSLSFVEFFTLWMQGGPRQWQALGPAK